MNLWVSRDFIIFSRIWSLNFLAKKKRKKSLYYVLLFHFLLLLTFKKLYIIKYRLEIKIKIRINNVRFLHLSQFSRKRNNECIVNVIKREEVKKKEAKRQQTKRRKSQLLILTFKSWTIWVMSSVCYVSMSRIWLQITFSKIVKVPTNTNSKVYWFFLSAFR